MISKSLRNLKYNYTLSLDPSCEICCFRAPETKLVMPRDIIILECTEAKAEGKPTSRYTSTRNKKSLRTPGRLEKVKYNPFLRRRTLHREMR